MNYVFYFVPFLALALGYLAGRYQAAMIDKIRTLEQQGREEPAEKPTVVMGAYTPPQEVSTAVDERSVGLVESKTPERVKWEQDQAIEREGRGY